MSKNRIEILTLYSLTDKDLIALRNSAKNRRAILILTTVLMRYNQHTVIDVYNSQKTITSVETIDFLQHLININFNKMFYVILDTAKFRTSKAVREFLEFKDEELSILYHPRYSLYINPQENIWNWLNSRLHKSLTRRSIDELI